MNLSYKDDRDRCYGAAGMAIGIVVVDGENFLSSLSVDAPADSMIEFTPDFYFSGNPSMSAKVAWQQTLRCYNLSMIASIANLLCRSMVMEGMPMRFEVKKQLHDVVCSEGRDVCSLDDDEVESFFNKNYDYLHRIFAHHGVAEVAHEMADTISRRRSMSRLEILEQLHALSMI